MTQLRAAMATDAGRVRTSNQDRALIAGDVVVVADGMGGHAGGEVAAATAVEAFEHSYNASPGADGLVAAAVAANREVFARAEREQALRGMGTTLTAAALVRDRGTPQIALVNVGDSRAYLFEGGSLRRLTEDHSLVEEMVRRGEITPEAALTHPHRHILTRALGIDPGVEIDSWLLAPAVNSRLLLCSDGLTNECSESEIAEVLAREADPSVAARELVARALGHGGSDNITVVIADLTEDEAVDVAAPPTGATRRDRSGGAAVAAASAMQADPEVTTSPAGSESASRVPIAPAPPPARARRDAEASAQSKPAEQEPPRPARERILTFRVALFTLVLLAVLGGIAGFVIWFNRATYFVGIADGHVAIFQGRPTAFLWFHPTLVEETALATSALLPANLPVLQQGVLESSYDGARGVVKSLTNERGLLGFGTAVSTTTTAPSTTLPAGTSATATNGTAATSTTSTASATTTTTTKGH